MKAAARASRLANPPKVRAAAATRGIETKYAGVSISATARTARAIELSSTRLVMNGMSGTAIARRTATPTPAERSWKNPKPIICQRTEK